MRCRKCGKDTLVRVPRQSGHPLRWSCMNVYCTENTKPAPAYVGSVRVLMKPKKG